MSEFYDMGVKLALEEISQAFKMTSSQSKSTPTKFKMPKIDKPKMPEKSKTLEKPNVAPPKPMPTRSPNTGPWGMRYGGRGTQIRNA
jgi:hypothetical protein